MSYSKSRARVSFEQSIGDLLRLSRFASLKKNRISYDHQNLIYQSAIFRACAAIEEYLKTFAEDLLFELKAKAAKLSDVPLNLRASSLLYRQTETFKTYIVNGDEASALKRLQPASFPFSVCRDDDLLVDQIGKNDVLGTKKYPSIKNLKVVYNRLGIPDVIQEAHKRGKKDYTNRLESFLSVREAISHQIPPPLTFEDVKRHFANILELLNQFDRISFSHMSKVSNKKFWPA